MFSRRRKIVVYKSIEHIDGRLLKFCEAGSIARASALRCDMVRVKLTMTRGEDSAADVLVVMRQPTLLDI